MPTSTDYQVYTINAFAVVILDEERVQIDIAAFDLTYSQNEIPFAAVRVNLGRRVQDMQVAAIHEIASDLTISVPVEIYLKVTPGPNSFVIDFESWPSGFFLVFQGVITGTSYDRTRENISFNMAIAHWLADTDSSSMLTRHTQALTPEQFNNLASFGLGSGVESINLFSLTSAAALFSVTNVNADFWGEALGPYLQELCQLDILDNEDEDNLQHNLEGLRAILRFEPFAHITDVDLDGYYTYGVPLELPIATITGSEVLATAIAEDVAQEASDGFRDTTLWNKLVAYGANYGFTIIPLVNTALIVPQIAGMRAAWQTIYAQEYTSIRSASQPRRPIKGVRLFAGAGSVDGTPSGQNNPNQQWPSELCGRYDNPDYLDGMIRYENAPRWVSNTIDPSAIRPLPANPINPRGDAFFPAVGLAMQQDLVQMRADCEPVWDAYARAIYIRETLRGRSGTLQGKLRFDVSPGSTIEIRCVEDRFLHGTPDNPISPEDLLAIQEANNLYAEVQSVGIHVDAENMTASTIFQLANVRSFAENSRDSTSINRHPLYEQSWYGAPLAENEEFIPEVNQVFED